MRCSGLCPRNAEEILRTWHSANVLGHMRLSQQLLPSGTSVLARSHTRPLHTQGRRHLQPKPTPGPEGWQRERPQAEEEYKIYLIS